MTETIEKLTHPSKPFPIAEWDGSEPDSRLADIGSADDLQLTRAASSGDLAAFEELYHRYHRRVYWICQRMVQNPADAEDLTQDVFVRLHKKVGTFRGDSAFTTWLHRLTINEVLMHFRKRYVRFETSIDPDRTPVPIAPGSANPKRMSLVDKIVLETAISQLPIGYRNVFVLHDVEGYEHEEVAKILGCAAGTSKSQLHKARLKVRKLLKKTVAPWHSGAYVSR